MPPSCSLWHPLLQPPWLLALPLSYHQACFWGLCTRCLFWEDSSSSSRCEASPSPSPNLGFSQLSSENLTYGDISVPGPLISWLSTWLSTLSTFSSPRWFKKLKHNIVRLWIPQTLYMWKEDFLYFVHCVEKLLACGGGSVKLCCANAQPRTQTRMRRHTCSAPWFSRGNLGACFSSNTQSHHLHLHGCRVYCCVNVHSACNQHLTNLISRWMSRWAQFSGSHKGEECRQRPPGWVPASRMLGVCIFTWTDIRKRSHLSMFPSTVQENTGFRTS